jgi:hypothetical protein
MSRSDEKQDKRPGAPVAPSAKATSCEGALTRVLQLAHSLAQDTRETRKTLPSGRAKQREEEPPASPALDSHRALAHEKLNAALAELDPETALKLRTLMVAGRDGRSIGAVNINLSMSDTEAGFAAMAADSGENGPLLIDYLRRGHAMACAAGIDLETPLSEWHSQGNSNLDERAWVSFGKQALPEAGGSRLVVVPGRSGSPDAGRCGEGAAGAHQTPHEGGLDHHAGGVRRAARRRARAGVAPRGSCHLRAGWIRGRRRTLTAGTQARALRV